MGLFLAIVIIATCVGANDAWSVLTPGYEYEFQYEGQVLSGIQTIDEQYSGVAFKSRVVIKSVSNALYVQFNEFQVGELNMNLDTVEVGEVPFKYNSIGEMEKYLKDWTTVVTDNGKIVEILVSPEEPTYVTNIKKGFLTNFNVNLPSPGSFTERKIPASSVKPQYYTSQSQEDIINKFRPYAAAGGIISGRPPNRETIDFPIYKAKEDGIEGNCPVHYVIESSPWPGNSTARVLNATAIVTFEDCEDDDYVDWLRTTHTPDSCSDCDEDDLDFLNTIKITEYDIREDLSSGHYVIERIESRTESLFILLTSENDQLSTNHSQVIELIRESRIQGEIPQLGNKKRIKTLNYHFPGLNHTQQLTQEDLYKRPAPFIVDLVPCAKQHIQRLTDEAAAIIKDRKTDNSKAVEKSVLLSRAYSTCSYEEIASIYQIYYPGRQSDIDSIEQIKWRVFRDTLMMSGTLPAITFLTHKVQKMEVTGEEANQIIMAIPLNIRAPAAIYIQEFLKLLKSEVVQAERQLYTTSWLAYASLIDVACGPDETVKPERPYVEDYCTDEQGKMFVKICARAAVQYPFLPCSIDKLLDPETVKPIQAMLSLQWGQSCQGTRNIKVFIPKWMVNATHHVEQWWKMMNYEFDSTDPKLDAYIFKPRENLFFHDIFYPGYSEYITPVNARTSW